MLLQTEQQSVRLGNKEKKLDYVLKENETLKKQYETLTDKERIKQQQDTLKLQNAIKKEELDYLRDMERKFKQIIQEWKKAANKQEVIAAAEKILFKRKQIQSNEAAAKKADKHYEVVTKTPQTGDLVRSITNHQVGTLLSLKDKKAVVQIGNLPFQVNIKEWVVVRKRPKVKKKD
jgi:DNA mismatch repair protein MutS2